MRQKAVIYLITNSTLFFIILFAAFRLLGGYTLSKTVGKMDSDPGGEIVNEVTAKKAALTFDDGPHPVYTEKLLDGLKQRNVKATFFLIGESIEGQETIVKRMAEEGHLIGNHTYHHVQLSKLNDAQACEEIMMTNNVVEELTGRAPEFIRPPFGAWNKNRNCPVEMISILWNVDPLDWEVQNTNAVVDKVLKEVKDGSIILLHDIYDTSVEAAFIIIDKLQEQGYELVTADQFILD